ncbi:MAG: late competence development ComFB family protein [Syntrophomonadaceae bacterium]|jgi:competence protein ComFB|nr:late competence development ComFB family protein [Syntrophomonadaceae bacterium]
MEVRNVVETLVWQNLDQVLDRKEGACKCERCRADIVARALNRLKPRYVVSTTGEVYVKAEFLEPQFQLDVITALAEAVNRVSNNPRHDKE